MTTIGTLFSGGEGVGVGARAAGLDHLWCVEYDDAIASVARGRGGYYILQSLKNPLLPYDALTLGNERIYTRGKITGGCDERTRRI